MSELAGNKFIIDFEVKAVDDFFKYQPLIENNPSVYEVMRIEESIPLFYENYIYRLTNSFHLLQKGLPYSEEEILNTIKKLIRINNYTSGPVKLVFGADGVGFFIAYLMKPHLPEPQEYITGVNTVVMKTVRDNPNLKLWNKKFRDKSVKVLENQDAYEAILVDESGNITEASRSNLFFIKENVVYTTPVEFVLPGITRKKVIEVCKANSIPVEYQSINIKDIFSYDACFLTGTARKIVPIKKIGNTSFKVDVELLKRISNLFDEFVVDYIAQH